MWGLCTLCWTPDCNPLNSCAYPEGPSSTAWGPSKLEVLHVRLLDAVAAIAMSKLQAVNGQNIGHVTADKVFLPLLNSYDAMQPIVHMAQANMVTSPLVTASTAEADRQCHMSHDACLLGNFALMPHAAYSDKTSRHPSSNQQTV